jgi:hypothetical protein
MKRFGVSLLALCGAALVSPLPAQDSAHSSGWIVIPATEYGTLRARAFPAAGDAEAPTPVEATLTRVDYNLKIDGELASGRANLTVDVLKDGWVHVPVPSGLLVREARLDGKLVSLVTTEDAHSAGHLSALLEKRGRSILVLDVALPVTPASGTEKLALPSSASGVTRASVTLTRLDMDIKVSGGFLAERAESSGESKWLAYGRGNEPLTFTWRRKAEDHKIELPLRMRGSLTELLGLGEDSTSLYAEVSADVVQGAAREVRVQLPEAVTVNQVLGATVGDWEDRHGELLVRFLEPVERTARFVITGDTRLPRDGAIPIPLMTMLEVERESGGVAVEVLGAGEIKDVKPQGLETAEAADLGAMVASRQSPSLAAFRFRPGGTAAARSLTIQVVRYEQQAVLTANIEEARYRVLMTRAGKTLVEARYSVRNNQRDFAKIALPQGAVVWSASLEGRPVHPGQAPDGSLLFPLSKSRAGEDAPPFAIQVIYQAPGARWEEKARAALSLPSLDLPISRTGVLLYHPPGYKVTAEPGTFRPGDYRQPASAALIDAPLSPPATAPPQSQSDLMQQLNNNAAQAATQALVDRYRAANDARKPAANSSVTLEFPAVGPSMFLVSELTSENQVATMELSYQRESKGGVK